MDDGDNKAAETTDGYATDHLSSIGTAVMGAWLFLADDGSTMIGSFFDTLTTGQSNGAIPGPLWGCTGEQTSAM